jgi:hypothetical protein
LRHVIECSTGIFAPGDFHLETHKDWFIRSVISAIGIAPLLSLVTLLLDLGANVNTVADDDSVWGSFLFATTHLMDGERQDQCWALLQILLHNGLNVNIATDRWQDLLHLRHDKSSKSSQNTLRLFKRLFSYGLRPNVVSRGETLFETFLHTFYSQAKFHSYAAHAVQCDILREFLRHGADITRVYSDTSSEAWFSSVLREIQELHDPCHSNDHFPRVIEFRILLDHGLDPDVELKDGRTLWECLLDAIGHGSSQQWPGNSYQRMVWSIVLTALQYGANPQASGLQQFLDWLKSTSCLLSWAEVREVEQLLHAEIDQSNLRRHSHRQKEAHQDSPSTIPGGSVRNVPIDTQVATRRDQKRKHGFIDIPAPTTDSKRNRYS